MKTQPTHEESTVIIKSEAAYAEWDVISKAFGKFTEAANQIKSRTIAASNLGREIGIHLQTLCGHEQVRFDFWQAKCIGKSPFDFKTAQSFVAIANRMPTPAETLEEALPVLRQCFFAGNLLADAQRTEPQARSNVSLMERFLGEFTLMRQPLKKILSERPMEEWELVAIDRFLSDTNWLEEYRERAAQLKADKEEVNAAH